MKAEVTDNNGQKYSVETILGANELYDVAKFKITAKTNAALFAPSVVANSAAWIVMPSQAGAPIKANIDKVENL